MSNLDTEILVTSKEFDPIFSELADYLDSCSTGRGGCERCYLQGECQQAFSSLMDRRTHYKLSQGDLVEFKRRFNSLEKQLTFC